MTAAAFNRGKSMQDVATPRELLVAFAARFGAITLDVAASPENAACESYYTQEQDGLTQSWETQEWAWCNPPYASIAIWAERMANMSRESRSFHGALLVPASIGAAWWRTFIHELALVHILCPRVPFVGGEGYPKDIALCTYSHGVAGYGYWDWQRDVPPVMLVDAKERWKRQREQLKRERAELKRSIQEASKRLGLVENQ